MAPSPIRRHVYVLRAFPEPSETFIRRELLAVARAGRAVTVIAAWRSDAGEAYDALLEEAGGPEVRYLLEAGPTPWGIPPVGDGAAVGFAPRRLARAARLAGAARRARALLPPDSVRLHAHFANDAATLARYLASSSGIPYDVTAHAYDLFQDPFLLGPNLRGAARIFTVSESNRAWLAARAPAGGWDPSRIELMRCGLDLPAYPPRTSAPVAPPYRVLCPARLVDKKGHDVMLEAAARLVTEGFDLAVDLAGDGPRRRDLEALVDRLGIAARVRFLGMVPAAAVQERMRAAHAVALASRIAADGDRDGLPVALIEAAATGVPVVTTAVSGIPELITEETGWIAAPGRVEDFTAALRDALTRTEEAQRRAAAARRHVEREFDVRRAAARLVDTA